MSDDLRAYLISLPTEEERRRLAAKCGTTVGHLRNVSYGDRRAAPDLCVELERETAGQITCESLRPDLPWSRQPDKTWPNKAGRPVLDFAKAAA